LIRIDKAATHQNCTKHDEGLVIRLLIIEGKKASDFSFE